MADKALLLLKTFNNIATMNLQNEFQSIRDWAEEKGILTKGDAKTQTVKLGEEFGELCNAVNKSKIEEAKDAVGDMVVVLTSISYHMGFSIEDAINSAYQEIKNRNGQMVNGNFVKK